MQWCDPRMAGWYRKGSVPRWKDAMVRSQNGGMVQKRVGPGKRAEKREKREERRERETSTTKISRSKDAMVRSENGGMVEKRVGP